MANAALVTPLARGRKKGSCGKVVFPNTSIVHVLEIPEPPDCRQTTMRIHQDSRHSKAPSCKKTPFNVTPFSLQVCWWLLSIQHPKPEGNAMVAASIAAKGCGSNGIVTGKAILVIELVVRCIKERHAACQM